MQGGRQGGREDTLNGSREAGKIHSTEAGRQGGREDILNGSREAGMQGGYTQRKLNNNKSIKVFPMHVGINTPPPSMNDEPL
ncbi:hypothetical protein Pmani_036286 [Petrolisthes manimaculis]|uniref:Uncharacterized protein n=1 Tax=Petrolisthes manimaculis TaxID=1843537 RepID=A0AAE1NKM9_9EUCA|nr:hypothetical protein Pmani_036286 [Petrolisthes manimaculis]